MGRPPKPTRLKELAGNPGKRALNKREPRPTVAVPTRPAWLLPEAKREWTRLARELGPLGLVTLVDRGALAAYCQSWARYVEAERRLTEMQSDPAVESIDLRRQAMVSNKRLTEVMALGAKFGLSPSDRTRLTVPTSESADPFEEFLRTSGQLPAANE